MEQIHYGLVCYVSNPVGRFVEQLRCDFLPGEVASPAHISILPPRPLSGSETEAKEMLRERCREVSPFEIQMGGVETFVPRTPTIFLQVERGAYRMRELHERLNQSVVKFDEPFPYMPHMTIVSMPSEPSAADALEIARRRWVEYDGPRTVLIGELVLVRGSREAGWVNLAPVPLGSSLVPAR